MVKDYSMQTGLSNTKIYYFVCISGSLQAGAGVNSVDKDAIFSPCFWSGTIRKCPRRVVTRVNGEYFRAKTWSESRIKSGECASALSDSNILEKGCGWSRAQQSRPQLKVIKSEMNASEPFPARLVEGSCWWRLG